MRESRGRTRHTLGRENEVPRIVQRRDEYDREMERGQYRPSGEDIECPGGRNPSIPRLQSSGNRPGCPPEENPKILAVMQEGRSMRGREVKGEGGRVLVFPLCRS